MKICVICHKEVDIKKAAKVKDDSIIQFIRTLKTMLKVAQNNELYVCQDDLENHTEKRKKFEKEFLVFTVIAAIVVIVLIGSSIASGSINIQSIIVSLLVGAIIISFSIFFKYSPAIEDDELKRMIVTKKSDNGSMSERIEDIEIKKAEVQLKLAKEKGKDNPDIPKIDRYDREIKQWDLQLSKLKGGRS